MFLSSDIITENSLKVTKKNVSKFKHFTEIWERKNKPRITKYSYFQFAHIHIKLILSLLIFAKFHCCL